MEQDNAEAKQECFARNVGSCSTGYRRKGSFRKAYNRILPRLGWLSDDVVIPLATSGSVAYLIKSKML
ncbi:uncharacterized protein C2845_PM07G35190 [Panicum miliaceum]|uniref:Uncharacterized protein n=1 Tax=Panicum miliaceum TaxID=4540 RepID=A0A3L6SM57_PANMI|nr:uncharacterized protein C2845_PM07G35190 [Panicum miliaceum]